MTLINRSNTSAEYADMLGTTPRKGSHTRPRSWLVDKTQVLKQESSLWAQSICPPVSEVKVVLGRLHSDPDMSLMNLFKYFVPVWTFGCVLALISWLSQQQHTRMLQQKATAPVSGDAHLPDIEWSHTTKPFLWAVFGGPLFVFIILAVLTHWIGRLVKTDVDSSRSWHKESTSGLPSSDTRLNGAWELEGVDVYSGMFLTV